MALALILAAALAQADASAFERFPVFVWRQDYAERPVPDALVAPFGGVNVEGAESAPVLEDGAGELAYYVGHAPGREELHLERGQGWYEQMWQEWMSTRDPALLVRRPCLADPATLDRLRARLERSLAARDGAFGRAVSLGDEVSLTAHGDPLDICQCAHCARAWRERNAAQGPLPLTDDVRLAWTTGDTAPLGAWLERRRFHQDQILGVLIELAGSVREHGAPVALLGCSGQTAFGGVSIPRILPHLDWLEAYSETTARELAHTLRDAGQSLYVTLFPADGNADRAAERLWEHVLRGGDGAIVWSDRHLAASATYLARLTKGVADVRALRAALPRWRPAPCRLAIVECADSLALSFLRDALSDGPTWPRRFAGYQFEHGTRERAVSAWLRASEDEGFLPGALPIEQVGPHWRERFGVLVCIDQRVLTAASETRLAAHLAAGGTIVVDGPFAEFDASGARRESPLPTWRATHAERVLGGDGERLAPAPVLTRLRGSVPSSAEEIELTVLAPLEPPTRWLVGAQREDDGRTHLAVLPRVGAAGSAPRAISVRVRARSAERALSVLHPPGADPDRIELRAGDALFLRLEAPPR